jgi:hypothetical protein
LDESSDTVATGSDIRNRKGYDTVATVECTVATVVDSSLKDDSSFLNLGFIASPLILQGILT